MKEEFARYDGYSFLCEPRWCSFSLAGLLALGVCFSVGPTSTPVSSAREHTSTDGAAGEVTTGEMVSMVDLSGVGRVIRYVRMLKTCNL